MTLTISRGQADQLRAIAAASPEEEICGLLLGKGHRITEIRRCSNVAADRTSTFEIDPAALVGAERAMRQGGAEIIGYFHSHPSGGCEPSLVDCADCPADGRPWLIVANGQIGAWQVERDGFRCQPLLEADCPV